VGGDFPGAAQGRQAGIGESKAGES
jgi:hypothetical protein